MRIAGIIAEFNPLHEGHQYLLDTVRREYDAVIVVMSGDFVQRGEPAVLDKFTRTRQALDAGADLVLELPVRFSLSSADFFAAGGVALLQGLGVVDSLVFGTEGALDLDDRILLAEFLLREPEEYRHAIQEFLRQGLSFPTARAKALRLRFPELPQSLYDTPNNILALSYCKALSLFSSPITPHPIPRNGDVSAHRIRQRWQAQNAPGIYPDDFSTLFHFRHWETARTDSLKSAPSDTEFTPELYHRLCRVVCPGDTLQQIAQKCKTKPYTYTRINRCLLRYMLGLQAPQAGETVDDFARYARVLGFRRNSAWLLKRIRERTHLPLVQKLADDAPRLNSDAAMWLQEDLHAHACYRIVASQKYPEHALASEYEQGVLVLP